MKCLQVWEVTRVKNFSTRLTSQHKYKRLLCQQSTTGANYFRFPNFFLSRETHKNKIEWVRLIDFDTHVYILVAFCSMLLLNSNVFPLNIYLCSFLPGDPVAEWEGSQELDVNIFSVLVYPLRSKGKDGHFAAAQIVSG